MTHSNLVIVYKGKNYNYTNVEKMIEILDLNDIKSIFELNNINILNSKIFYGMLYIGNKESLLLPDTMYCKTIEYCRYCDTDLDDNNFNGNDKRVCNECLDKYYEMCNICHKYELKSDFVTLKRNGNTEKMCRNCVRGLSSYRCARCGCYYIYDENNHNNLCNDCAKEYDFCINCGGTYKKGTMEFLDMLCKNCIREKKKKEALKNYSYKPAPEFKKSDKEKRCSGNYMGLELEFEPERCDDCDRCHDNCENDNYDCEDDDCDECDNWSSCHNHNKDEDDTYEIALKIMEKVEDFAYIKTDGSLDCGFEFVTHPISLKGYLDNYLDRIEEVIDIANDLDYFSKNENTGLHIHYNKEALGNNSNEIDEVISKIIYLMSKDFDFVTKFSRRDKGDIMHWAAKYDVESDGLNCEASNLRNISTSRYHCLNLQNRNTIEFRVFKGTDDINTIKASILFVSNIVEFCKAKTKEEVLNATIEEAITFRYTSFMKNYLLDNGLIKEPVKKFEEVLEACV